MIGVITPTGPVELTPDEAQEFGYLLQNKEQKFAEIQSLLNKGSVSQAKRVYNEFTGRMTDSDMLKKAEAEAKRLRKMEQRKNGLKPRA